MKKQLPTPRFLGVLATLVASGVPSGNAQIAIDEGFDDWSGSMPLCLDGEDVVGVQDLLIVLSNFSGDLRTASRLFRKGNG
jgi:hypothetical protein